MNYEKAFEEAYKKLNKEQKLAVDTIDGPVMVVAGPGTGKTQILTLRIANILKNTDVGPSSILAITFTESGVRAMRKRLLSIIGPDAHKVHINTFHGFCNNLIMQYPEYFPDIVGSNQMNEVDSVKIIENIIDEVRPKLLRPRGDVYLYVHDIIKSISELKREGFRSKKFKELVEKSQIEFDNNPNLYHEKGAHKGKMKSEFKSVQLTIQKNVELANIYEVYEQKMADLRFYDYGDMILCVQEALEQNEDFRQIVQESYQYILVDEHQDTNQSQNSIIDILVSFFIDSPNLFVVGDDKQGVYRFQGASVLNFTDFIRKYPKTKVINLVENYRSDASILAYAQSILSGREPLKSQTKNFPKINVYECDNRQAELANLAIQIKNLIKDGVPPKEIAILHRKNKEAIEITNLFSKDGIKYTTSSDFDIYDTDIGRKFLKLVEAVCRYEDESFIMSVMHIRELGLHPHDIYSVIRKVKDAKQKSLYSFLYDKDVLLELNLINKDSFLKFADNLKEWIILRDEKNARQMSEILLRDSGILNSVIQSPNVEDIENLNSLMSDINNFLNNDKKSNIIDFYEYINLKRRYKIKTKANLFAERDDSVRVMTAHGSKGLEFEYVFVIHSNSGIWNNSKKSEKLKLIPQIYGLNEKSDDGLDERRLFYVAVTRAKKGLSISYSIFDSEGKDLLPAEYIENIPDEHRHHVNIKFEQDYFIKNIEKEELPKNKVDIDFVNKLLDNSGMSPTALNNYLSCPWKYFYRNLIKLPEPTEAHLSYGTAMHAGVENLFKKDPYGQNFEELIKGFDESLLKQPISKDDFKDFIERGRQSLTGWYEHNYKKFIYPRKTESKIERVSFDEVVYLTGKLDAIEQIEEGLVRVIDYKTGNPKTRNEIMGNTKNSDGGYYRQLVFYKLLIELDKKSGINMQSATLDFLEPDKDSGKYKSEEFEISNEEVIELKKEIVRVAHEIRNLDFWDKKCHDKECKYCSLRQLMNS